MKTIKFELNCGEFTCAAKPGEWCQFLGAKKFGSIPTCLLFRDDQGDLIELRNTGGVGTALQRMY